MMCYYLAEILISAGLRFDHDIQLFSAGRGENLVLEANMCANGLYPHMQTMKAVISLEMREIKVARTQMST